MLIRNRRLLIIVIVIANSCDVEELVVILEFDPKETVVFLLKLWHLFARKAIPLPRAVAPVSVPLLLAPRISDLKQSNLLTRARPNFPCLYQTVSVRVDQTHGLHIFGRHFNLLFRHGRNCAAHNPVSLVSSLDRLPQPFFILPFVVDEVLRRTASQRLERLSRSACLYSLVTSIHFCPCFF